MRPTVSRRASSSTSCRCDRPVFLQRHQLREKPATRTGTAPRQPVAGAGDTGLPVIVLDPGHGGIDSGAVTAKGDQEKTIVLDFARALAAKIEATGR